MDLLSKLSHTSENKNLEGDIQNECPLNYKGTHLDDIPITQAVMPGGKRMKLLKTAMSTACERNCFYCPFRSGRNTKRITFKPDEMAELFYILYQKKVVEGLFLSSGVIGGGIKTQDMLIDTTDILRHKYHYKGYIHLKVMPGAEYDQVVRSMELASRVSVNLEGANDKRLGQLAPQKKFIKELLEPLKWMKKIRSTLAPSNSWNKRWPSSTTQFVVGAAGENDLELLSTSDYLISRLQTKRIYYSRFNPIQDTPFENQTAEDPKRQHRLYQSSYLLRDYGFSLEDMPFNQSGNLPLKTDPKLAWAHEHLAHSPIEINRASRVELLRIPGIGPTLADRVLEHRPRNPIRTVEDMKNLNINLSRSTPFILINGIRPIHQPALF